ncbi:MAG: hypothetical protein KGJ23_04490 [Euryarchaeota archaeon]|nr:hypothetical protein [Euryarchaeota archaeon]MDE1835857.1 hypothetical protein [Euryarchaeota archaeon]MDE1879709.1 hypothetical protein [Euryarchaeota archaeon]MDE2045832.1 hypothetical protein [Thermoplasmata archaeon]
MSAITEKRLGYGLGLLGGLLIGLAGLVSLFTSAVNLAVGRAAGAIGYGSEGIVLLILGGLALLFAHLGYRQWNDRPIVSGVLLVVVAALGWGVLGLGSNVIAFLGAIFVLLAGVLYLVVPVSTRVAQPAPA